jgi:hypothetical protein
MRKMTKKSKVAALAASVALVAVGGGAAYAYWSTTGSGSGHADNSAGTSAVTLHANFADGLAPGNSVPVTYTADNPNSSSTTVTLDSAIVSVDLSHSTCDAAWFDVVGAPIGTTKTVAAGTVAVPGTATLGAGSLLLKDLAVPQDGCKGATVTLTLASH